MKNLNPTKSGLDVCKVLLVGLFLGCTTSVTIPIHDISGSEEKASIMLKSGKLFVGKNLKIDVDSLQFFLVKEYEQERIYGETYNQIYGDSDTAVKIIHINKIERISIEKYDKNKTKRA